jgi:hypothetical protein
VNPHPLSHEPDQPTIYIDVPDQPLLDEDELLTLELDELDELNELDDELKLLDDPLLEEEKLVELEELELERLEDELDELELDHIACLTLHIIYISESLKNGSGDEYTTTLSSSYEKP